MQQTEEYVGNRDQKNREQRNERVTTQSDEVAKPIGMPIKRKQPIVHVDDNIEEIPSDHGWIEAGADRNPKRGKGLNVKEQRDKNSYQQNQRNALEVVNKKKGKGDDSSAPQYQHQQVESGAVYARNYGRTRPSDTNANRKNDLSTQSRKDTQSQSQGQRTAKRQKLNSRDGPAEVIDLACDVSSDSEAEREEVEKVKTAKGIRYISTLVAQEAGLLNVTSLLHSGKLWFPLLLRCVAVCVFSLNPAAYILGCFTFFLSFFISFSALSCGFPTYLFVACLIFN